LVPVLFVAALALLLLAQNRTKYVKLITFSGLALVVVCTSTAYADYYELSISPLSAATMVAGLILLLYYLVEIEKRFTRLGAYPFALLILIHQMEYTIYY
jgi:hypothetical protein